MARVVRYPMNKKLGRGIVATYTAEHTCPRTCAIREQCYAKHGQIRLHWERITKLAASSQLGEAVSEAAQLLTIPKGKPVRLHVAGDMGSSAGAKIIATAVAIRELVAFGYTA